MTDLDTKDKILDAAEKLFSDNGFSATSVRAVIKEAGVNTASVHYHFHSREGLIEAVLRRHAEPVNEERLRRLDALESGYPKGSLPVEELLRAFIEPAARLRYQRSSAGVPLPKLMARAIAESDESFRVMMHDIFIIVFERFALAFQRSLPDIDLDEIHHRMHFMIGALAFSVAVPAIVNAKSPAPTDMDEMIEQIIRFNAAGMRAAVVTTNREEKR
jgi:AcrR family transcriptional regulator